MNLTDLREELADQADQMDSRHPDLLPEARRRARRYRAVRTTGAAAAIAVVAVGSTLVVPNLLPQRDAAPTFEPPVASAPATEPRRAPIHGVMRGDRIELAPGLFFVIRGKNWYTVDTVCPKCVPINPPSSKLELPTYGRQGMVGQGRPDATNFLAMDIVQGDATQVIYTVKVKGGKSATYEADVYDVPSWPHWTVAYVDFPRPIAITQPSDDAKLEVTFRAYDASGRLIPQVPPTYVPPTGAKSAK